MGDCLFRRVEQRDSRSKTCEYWRKSYNLAMGCQAFRFVSFKELDRFIQAGKSCSEIKDHSPLPANRVNFLTAIPPSFELTAILRSERV
jgi:hypothetical protein